MLFAAVNLFSAERKATKEIKVSGEENLSLVCRLTKFFNQYFHYGISSLSLGSETQNSACLEICLKKVQRENTTLMFCLSIVELDGWE